ncbi:TPA: EamA family transporter [Klebsiella pneumoniae]|nr:EamA family transporter [Escherichia coli]HBM3200147.1 EamA family transporter [Klebsiella michiganensis]HBW4829249.1 EamA family transporter [Klebsiella pneumoniae]HBW5248614.1 EamA family transporter [Klebsiella pneumoniae]HBW6210630.1 EamA family transporter [Klebsiella pneumoniae]
MESLKSNSNLILEISFLVLLSFVWGNSFVLMKVAVESIPPLTLTAFRVTLAAAILYGVTKYYGQKMPASWSAWTFFAVQGFLQCALPYTLISWGEKEISSGLAGVLNATPPVFVLLISLFTGTGKHMLSGRKITGTAIGMLGVISIMGFSVLSSVGSSVLLAQFAVLGASLCYAISPLIVSRYASISPLITSTGSMLSASAMMLPVALVVDSPWRLTPSVDALLAAAALAVVCTALAMLMYFRLVNTLGPLITASGGYLRAGFSVLSGVLFLNERSSLSTATGMLLIVVGIMFVTVPPRKKNSEMETRN